MNVYYALWVGFWAVFGQMLGSVINWVFIRVSGKQSIIVWTLVAMFVLEIAVIPTVGWY
jgi:hypothetical protein